MAVQWPPLGIRTEGVKPGGPRRHIAPRLHYSPLILRDREAHHKKMHSEGAWTSPFRTALICNEMRSTAFWWALRAEPPEQQAAPGDEEGAPAEQKSAADAKELQRLIERFEGSILPKIRSQIAGLDQLEPKNAAMLELRRELQVRPHTWGVIDLKVWHFFAVYPCCSGPRMRQRVARRTECQSESRSSHRQIGQRADHGTGRVCTSRSHSTGVRILP